MKIKRLIFDVLAEQINEPKISFLIGPRQVGKTFLLREIEAEAMARGLKCAYFDLENPEHMLSLGANDKDHFDVLTNSGEVVLIDELHLIKNISHIFKAIHDDPKKKIKIFASGSSALEMHKHLKESMAGRFILNRIFPLTAEELLQNKNCDENSIFIEGGMPGLVNRKNSEEKLTELASIVSAYISKDIKGLIKEENVRAFNQMMYLLAERQGSVCVAANLSNEIDVSKPTVEKYLEILSQTYVCHSITSYAKNLGNELKKSKKHYFFDLGIRNFLLKDFREMDKREDSGILRESFVLLSLIKQLKPNMEIKFWRTKQGHEVDFIVLKNRQPLAIEVKSKLSEPAVPSGMKKFLDAYPEAVGGIVYCADLIDEIEYSGRKVSFQKIFAAENLSYAKNVI